MTVTIKDVARLAEVSVATVSRVMNGTAPVSEGTRMRVLDIARQLRFAPNGSARALSRQRTGALGVVLPDLYGEFFSELLRGMDQTAQRADHSLLVSSSHHDARGVGFAVGAMRGRVDGLIVMAPELAASDVAEVLPHGLPTILLNGHGEGEALQSISVDNFGGARAMTKHLLSLGRRRIGFVCGAAHNADATARERGHHAALREAGESHDRTLDVRGDFTEASGWRAAQRLTSLDVPPSAIFAANDAMAVGVLSYLRAAGIDVPSQIAVVGFDDIPVARFLTPPLTTVRVGVAALGARATAVLLQALERSPPDGANARHEVLPTDLVVRGSCGAPPASQVSLAPLSLPSEDLFR